MLVHSSFPFFFFNDTATTEIYTLSLHDALPISFNAFARCPSYEKCAPETECRASRSEEHTSELQSPDHLVCRLLLEKKKTQTPFAMTATNAACTFPSTRTPATSATKALPWPAHT